MQASLFHIQQDDSLVKARGHVACVFPHLAEVKEQHFPPLSVNCVWSLMCGMSVGISQPVSSSTRLGSVNAVFNPQMTLSSPNMCRRAHMHTCTWRFTH